MTMDTPVTGLANYETVSESGVSADGAMRMAMLLQSNRPDIVTFLCSCIQLAGHERSRFFKYVGGARALHPGVVAVMSALEGIVECPNTPCGRETGANYCVESKQTGVSFESCYPKVAMSSNSDGLIAPAYYGVHVSGRAPKRAGAFGEFVQRRGWWGCSLIFTCRPGGAVPSRRAGDLSFLLSLTPEENLDEYCT